MTLTEDDKILLESIFEQYSTRSGEQLYEKILSISIIVERLQKRIDELKGLEKSSFAGLGININELWLLHNLLVLDGKP